MRRLFAVLVLVLPCASVAMGLASLHPQAQVGEALFQPAELREDLAILRGALEETHIGLYRYADKATIDAAFDTATREIDRPMSEPQFVSRIARLLAPIRDDHTFVLPSQEFWSTHFGPGAPSAVPTAEPRLKVLPIYVKVIGDRIFVTHDNSRERSVPRGAEVISINGRPSADILKTLDAYLPTSGFSTTYGRRHLEQFHARQEFNVLCVYYVLFVESPQTFALRMRTYGSETDKTIAVAALPYQEVVANSRSRYGQVKDRLFQRTSPIELTWPTEATALLRLSSFHDWQWNQAKLRYQPEIAGVFREINEKGARNVIVDLRGNEGGSAGIAIEVLAHSVNQPFQVYAYKEMKAYRPAAYAKYMRDPGTLTHFTDSLFERMADGTFRIRTTLPDETWSRPMNPTEPTYDGTLYVLIDGATGSAAAQLATLLRVNRRDAIFIGEESGGDMSGPVSGSYIDLRLPRTGVRIDVPLLRKVMHLNGYPSMPGRGVIPDHAVTWTAADIVQGNEPELALALELIDRAGR